MSKRFGRNQKRALKQVVEKAEASLAFMHLQQKMLSNTISQQQEIIGTVADVLGRHFIALPPETIPVKDICDYFQLPRQPRVDDFMRLSGAEIREFVRFSCYQLEVFETELRRDDLMANVHILCRSRNHKVGYGISAEALRKIDKRHLADLIAMSFADAIKGQL